MKIFISYAREDRKMAERLFADFSTAGLDPWLDTEKILPGQRFENTIRDALRESDFVCLLLSSRSLNKRGFVQREVALALRLLEELPENEVFIVPVRLDDSVPSIDALRELQWVDLFDDYESGLIKLFKLFKRNDHGQFAISFPKEAEPQTFTIPYDTLTAFYRLHVLNRGRVAAHGCTGKLISVRDQASPQVDLLGRPLMLKWAHEEDFCSISIEPGESRRLDLFYVTEGGARLEFYIERPRIPVGIRRSFPPGGYIVEVQITADGGVAPSKETFLIENDGNWLTVQVCQVRVEETENSKRRTPNPGPQADG